MSTVDIGEEIDALLGNVEDVMERDVVYLRPDQPLGEAARMLERAGVSGGPVIREGVLVGIVSLSDLFAAAGLHEATVATSGPWHRYEHLMDRTGRTVASAMGTTVVSVPPGTPVALAAAVMRERRVHRIPVVGRDGVLRGIVARDDVIEAVAAASRAAHAARGGVPLDLGPR